MNFQLFGVWTVVGVAVISLVAPGMVAAQKNAPVVPPGAKLVKLADGFSFTEGPAVDRDGNVWFTDQPKNKIWIWDVHSGRLREAEGDAARANGLFFDRRGNLISAAEEFNEIRSTSPDGTVEVLARRWGGGEFNGPNDVWVHPRTGDIYFTDPIYPRSWWTHRGRTSELDGEHVYRIAAKTGAVSRVATDLRKPNGIVGTRDGRTLYIADIGAGRTWAYTVAKDGSLGGKRLFVEMGSDGMTIDERGNVYLTGKGVTVFNPRGEKIAHIDIPSDWTANAVFGGTDRRTLFITAQDGLYSVETSVKGVK